MGVYTDDNKLVIITEPKTISFDLTKKVDNSLKYEADHMKHKGFLAEHKKKQKLSDYCLNISIKTIFMNTEKT